LSKSTIAIVVLSVAFLGSNAWWAYQLLDAGVTQTYTDVSNKESQQALAQSLAVISAASSKDATRESVIAAANQTGNSSEPFEKDGFVWVGQIGLKFDTQGKLIAATTSGDVP
jgi:hypothetical protein